MTTAQINGTLEKKLRFYTNPQLLLLDELGDLPIDKRGADLLFQVVAARYQCGSIVVSTNRAFRDWGTIFDVDNTLATAMIDRLMHHGEVIIIRGDSYRMKDKPTEQLRPRPRSSGMAFSPDVSAAGGQTAWGARLVLRIPPELPILRFYGPILAPRSTSRLCERSPLCGVRSAPCAELRRAPRSWLEGTAAAEVPCFLPTSTPRRTRLIADAAPLPAVESHSAL